MTRAMLPRIKRRRLTRRWLHFVLAPRSVGRRYGIAVLLASSSLILVYAIPGLLESELSSLALFTVVLSALYGGLGPALLDTVITAAGIDYLFPLGSVFETLLRLVVFGLVGYVIAEIVSSLRDAYARLHAEHRQAEEAKRAREDVLAIVSHDLRSPLSAILLGAEYLLRGALPQEKRRATAETILRSGRQMSRLIEDLLDAVRIEKGQFRLQPQAHRLDRLADQALEGVVAAAEERGVRIERRVPEADYGLVCDGERIVQVLANLLANAVKVSAKGGTVELELRAAAAEVSATVSDSGPGISQADLPSLFQRYWRAEAAAHRGTGLGLFIAKSIVDAHGGSLHVVSRPGRGAAFMVALPRGRAG